MCPSGANICRDILCTISIAKEEVDSGTDVKPASASFTCSEWGLKPISVGDVKDIKVRYKK